MSIFKQIIDARTVETWVRDTLVLWFEVYLREFEKQRNFPPKSLPLPRSFIIAEETDREAADQTPTIVVVSPGTINAPEMRGDGGYWAWWQIGLGIFAEANTRENTDALVRYYAAVARAIGLQKGSMGGFVEATIWERENFDVLDFEDNRTISAGEVWLNVLVANVVNTRGGPVTPPDPVGQPGSNWPTVDEVIVDVEKVPITEEVDGG